MENVKLLPLHGLRAHHKILIAVFRDVFIIHQVKGRLDLIAII
jgi:hypothetical protein